MLQVVQVVKFSLMSQTHRLITFIQHFTLTCQLVLGTSLTQLHNKEKRMLEKIQMWIYSQSWRFWIGVDFVLWAVLIVVGMWFFF
jgi:hypothetical protein